MKNFHGDILFIFLIFCGAVQPAAAEVVHLLPSKDNTLYEPELALVSNGAGQHLFAGVTHRGFVRRAVLAFDVAGAIPAGSVVNQVALTLHVSRTNAGSEPVSLHRLEADWGEAGSEAPGEEGGGAPPEPNDATWEHRFYDTVFWTSPGGDFSPVASASIPVGGVGPYVWSSATMAADVQGWLDAPQNNFGWLMRGNEDAPSDTSKRFDSRENVTAATRPSLLVDFTPPLSTFVSVNQTLFSPGDTLVLSVGVENRGLSETVDFYLGVLLPDGDTLLFFTDLSFQMAPGQLSNLTSADPIVAGVDLTGPFTVDEPAFFEYVWTGAEPPGNYVVFLAAAAPGAFSDGTVDPGDLLSISMASFSFAR